MTPTQELRSLRAKLKRRDAKILGLMETANVWCRRAAFLEMLWENVKEQNRELNLERTDEMLNVARLQGEIATIHTTYALRYALNKLQTNEKPQ